MRHGLVWLGVLPAVWVCASAQESVRAPQKLLELLQRDLGIGRSELNKTLQRGMPAVKILPRHVHGEIAIAGVDRMGVPLDFFLDAFRGMPTLKRGKQALIVREFSDPPRLEDLQQLPLTTSDIQGLAACRPGKCSVKFSPAMMEQLHAAAGSGQNPSAAFKTVLLDYVRNYLAQGNAAMITYADKLPPISSAEDSRTLLQEAGWLQAEAAPLYSCLESFSGRPCPQIDSFLYWSSAKFGLKPVFSITDVMIYRTQKDSQAWVFIAFKQIYADHYIQASLGLAVLVQESADPAHPQLWIVYVNRSRTDAIGGFFGRVKRSIAENRSSAAMRRNLEELKESLERKYMPSSRLSAR